MGTLQIRLPCDRGAAGVAEEIILCYRYSMRRTAPILIVILLAMLIRPLQLPAASCIFSKGADPRGCKPHCCANKSCCALSEKNKGPAEHPLVQDNSVKQPVFGLTAVLIFRPRTLSETAFVSLLDPSSTRHSLPPLAASCIRLI
jgi:hypothetical protein